MKRRPKPCHNTEALNEATTSWACAVNEAEGEVYQMEKARRLGEEG